MIYSIRRFSSDKFSKGDTQIDMSEANKFKMGLQKLSMSMGNSGDTSSDISKL